MECRVVLSVGGGSTSAGLLGEYFNNLSLSGSPAFTRDDVRIDFDWRGTIGPGGSSSPGFSTLGENGFSVRWTGQLVPRFSETYVFNTTTAGGVRFSIKAADSTAWTQLINDWVDHETPVSDVGSISLTAGQAYDVEMDYFAANDGPVARLSWSSDRTPSELIEPLGTSGYNFLPYQMPASAFANAIKQGRDEWLPINGATSVPTDSNGWPLSDAKIVVWEGQIAGPMAGTYLLQFQGKADVLVQQTGFFTVGGTNYGNKLPSGAGYDAATNTTTAYYTTPGDSIMSLTFSKTQQKASSDLNTGLSNIHLMRPKAIGGTTTYSPDTLFTDTLKDAMGRFTTIRYHTSVTANNEVNWSDRVLPGYFNARHGFANMAWENLVMLSNELGKDMYVEIPMGATDDYITRLAKLLRYGSDGVNPYNSVQANPVYPPLNPNLRLYVEWSNETWNSGYTQYSQGIQLAKDAVANNTADGKIINFDGKANWQRWTAVRTVDSSNIFRSVWGDAAMGNLVRVVLEFQPNNGQDTGSNELGFIDTYFNNGDGVKHVDTPRPVSYYLWGAGGANYYGGGNERGYQTATVFQDEGFESPALAPGSVAVDPAGTPWTFSGNAGIVGPSPTSPAPKAPEGKQQMFIRPGGRVSQTINFAAAGIYAVDFLAAAPDQLQNGIDVYFDNQKINASTYDPTSYLPSSDPWLVGRGWGQNYRSYQAYGSSLFRVDSAGDHTITIVGSGGPNESMDPRLVLYLDRIRISSLDTLYSGGVPYQGFPAFSDYQSQVNDQSNYPLAYGLHVVSYEGGWAMGGDFWASPLQNFAKFRDPRTKQVNLNAIDANTRSGGELLVWGSYSLWEDIEASGSYPLVQAVDERNRVLPAANQNGMAIPATLTNENMTLMKGGNKGYFYGTGMATWNVFVPTSGLYQFSASGGTSGGTFSLEVDSRIELGQAASDSTLSATPFLTAGFHVVVLRNLNGLYNIPKIAITSKDVIPAAPTGMTATAAATTKINLGWVDRASNETGYKVYRADDPAFTRGVKLLTTTAANATSWQDTGLSANATYYYRVGATNAIGDSIFGTTVPAMTTPSAGSISGRVFSDTLGNGTADSDDPGLSGWTVTVLDSSGKKVATTVSTHGGRYLLTGLSAGTYTVQETAPSGWVQTSPPSKSYNVALDSGAYKTGLDFGNFVPVNVTGKVFNDLAGDGVLSRNDIGLADWKIDLIGAENKVIASTTTGDDGSYSFALPGPGRYTVRQTEKSGWTPLDPADPATEYTFQASSGVDIRRANFSYFKTVSVSGIVYKDSNGNGFKNSGEGGLSNWVVNLLDAQMSLVSKVKTSSGGKFTISKLKPGDYTVQLLIQPDWISTQRGGSGSYSFTVTSSNNRTGLDFANFNQVQLSGFVYNDNDGNGSRGGTDKGMSDRTVELRDSNGFVVASTVTDKSGKYVFTGVGPGRWTIHQIVQPGWIQTQPTSQSYFTVYTKSGLNVSGQSFGDHESPSLNPTAMIDALSTGYTETGTWTTAAGGFGGSSRSAQTAKSGLATATSQWKFTGLGADGTFDVYVTYTSKRSNSTAAPFTVYDSETALETVNVKQNIPVTMDQKLDQGSYGGVGWIKIGSYRIKSGVLSVVLSNQARGSFVNADGVLIVKQGAAAAAHASSTNNGDAEVDSTVTATASVAGTAAAAGQSSANSALEIPEDQIGALPMFYDQSFPGGSRRKGTLSVRS